MGAVLTILGPNQLSKITNLISDSLAGEIDLAAIGRVAGVLLGIYALSALLTYIEHSLAATVTLGLSKQMRRDLCAKINRAHELLQPHCARRYPQPRDKRCQYAAAGSVQQSAVHDQRRGPAYGLRHHDSRRSGMAPPPSQRR